MPLEQSKGAAGLANISQASAGSLCRNTTKLKLDMPAVRQHLQEDTTQASSHQQCLASHVAPTSQSFSPSPWNSTVSYFGWWGNLARRYLKKMYCHRKESARHTWCSFEHTCAYVCASTWARIGLWTYTCILYIYLYIYIYMYIYVCVISLAWPKRSSI